MIPKIYGNDPVLSLIRTMRERDHLPHAALLFGEKGMGRKTIARYFAMTGSAPERTHPAANAPPAGSSCRTICRTFTPIRT